MSRNRELANIIAGGFTVDDLPTLTETQIPNLSASKITSGTFADARISASNVSQHAVSFDDDKLVNDISTLALRQASNENKAAYNTNSMYVDVFQDDTGIDTETQVDRNTNEFMSSIIVGSPVQLDYFNPTQAGGGTTNYQLKLSTSAGHVYTQYRDTYVDIPTSGTDNARKIDVDYTYTNGGYLFYTNNLGTDAYLQIDYKEVKNFSGGFKILKAPSWGDLNQARIQYSSDDSTYTNLDLSGASVSGTNPIFSGTGYSGAAIGSFGSDGTLSFGATVNLNNHGVQNIHAHVDTGVPDFSARYIRIQYLSKHSFTSVGGGGFTPYVESRTTNATGNFTGNTITAPSSVSSMGAIITYQDFLGTNALNTDIVLKLSADNGSNYSTATLTAMPDFSTGIKMAKVNDLSVTAGTQLKYKIEFANQSGSKEARIRGVSLQY
jgi:hypothetical protein